MKGIKTVIKSDEPPCDKGCSMRSFCAQNNDSCAQRKHWDSHGTIDIERCRLPSKNKRKMKNLKQVKRPEDPQVIVRQMKVREVLNNLTPGQITELAPLLKYTPKKLMETRGLSQGFNKRLLAQMESKKVKTYLNSISGSEAA